MKMKLIISLLVLCLAFSIGFALAQTDTTGSMDKSMAGKMMAGNMDKMAGGVDQATIIVSGKVNGTVTVDKMTGMAGGMGSAGKTMTRKFSGDMIVVKDISNKTETTMMIGKMDGMTKRVVMIGKTQYGSGMSGENEAMTGMAGGMDNKAGAMDNEKVVVTGDITCMTVGKMFVLGQPSDLKEMSDENAGMTGMSEENETITGTPGNMDNMAGTMDSKKVIATATIRCNMTGKMIIIGKLSDIKKEMMAGSEKEGMQGVAAYKAGAAGVSNEDMKGAAAYKAGAGGVSNEDMKGAAAYKAGAAGVSNEDIKGAAAYKAGAAGVSNEDMTGVAAYKAGAAGYKDEGKAAIAGYKAGAVGYTDEGKAAIAGYKAGAVGVSNEDLTIIMTGITKCKITGINMMVIGKMAEMTGTQTDGMMEGKESKYGMHSGASSNQSQSC